MANDFLVFGSGKRIYRSFKAGLFDKFVNSV